MNFLFVCLAAHESEASSMDSCKRQTATATPAEPGELPSVLETVWELGLRGFALALIVIQAPDVDTKDPGPNGQDRQEDEALSV